MSDLENIPLKKLFLKSLIISVGISAALGILAILVGDFGKFEMKVLLTTLTISAASLCGLCCGAAIELRRQRELPILGILLAGIAAVFLIAGIWLEIRSDAFWKITATSCLFAVSLSHLALLSLARLSPSFAWSMAAAYAAVLSVAGLASGMLWGELDSEFLFRLLGVLGILDGAVTILIPIFHRLSQSDLRPEDRPSLADLDHEIALLEERLRELKAKREAASQWPNLHDHEKRI